MKRFLLVFGILLCMQCCTFARNLCDVGNGIYVDVDSFRHEGNYGYALVESPIPHHNISCEGLFQFDLLNSKFRVMKVYARNNEGKVIAIIEEFDLPQDLKEWHSISENSLWGAMFEMVKEEP